MKEFNAIIKLSNYDCVNENLIKIPKKKILTDDTVDASKDVRKYLNTMNNCEKIGRQHRNNLPRNCGITPDMIPKYCYYQAATDKRGDAFVIDRHPKLPKGKRQWKTSGSKYVDTYDKFIVALAKIESLEGIEYDPKKITII